MPRFYIQFDSPALIEPWFMTKKPFEPWIRDKSRAEEFLSREHAQRYLTAIGHSLIGIRIVGE